MRVLNQNKKEKKKARGLIFSILNNGTLRYVLSKNDTPGATIEKVIIFPTF